MQMKNVRPPSPLFGDLKIPLRINSFLFARTNFSSSRQQTKGEKNKGGRNFTFFSKISSSFIALRAVQF